MSSTWLRLSGVFAAFVLLLVVQSLLFGAAGAAPAAEVPTPTPTPTPGPVSITPFAINYGTTTVGRPLDADIFIFNNGPTSVSMDFPSLTNNTNFAIVTFGSLNISGYSSSFVRVRLLATQRGTFGGQLVIRFSNVNNGLSNFISLQGRVTAPLIRVTDGSATVASGTQYNLGSTPFNVVKDKQFVIVNDGDAILNPNLTLSGTGFFLIESPATSVGANGGTTTFTIRLLANSSGTFNGNVSISSNDTTQNPYTFSLVGTVGTPPPTPTPTPPPPPAPRLGLVSGDGITITHNGSYAFPSTPACVAVSRGFTITNNGNATLTISGVSVTGEGWSVVQDPPGSIPAGGTGGFRLRLLSCTAGDKIGQVTISSNDPIRPSFRYTVTGTVTGSSVRVVAGDGITVNNGSTYSIGSTPVGVALGRAFTIYNDGNAPLTISNMTVTGAGFSLLIAPPATIDAYSSGVFRVRLQAGTAGSKTGQVSFNTNAVGNNPFSFTVTGTVTP